jgi:hypothetical protein
MSQQPEKGGKVKEWFKRTRKKVGAGVRKVGEEVKDIVREQIDNIRLHDQRIKDVLSQDFSDLESSGHLRRVSNDFGSQLSAVFEDPNADKEVRQIARIANYLHGIAHPNPNAVANHRQLSNQDSILRFEEEAVRRYANHLLVQQARKLDEVDPEMRLHHETAKTVLAKGAKMGTEAYLRRNTTMGEGQMIKISDLTHDAIHEIIKKQVINSDGNWEDMRDVYGLLLKHGGPEIQRINGISRLVPRELTSLGFMKGRLKFDERHVEMLAAALYAVQYQTDQNAFAYLDKGRAFYAVETEKHKAQQLSGGRQGQLPPPQRP